ncbi:MAG: hypothetical protein WBW37_11110, partial [Methyloceanibacter sp.]
IACEADTRADCGAFSSLQIATSVIPQSQSRFLRRDIPPVDAFSQITRANEPCPRLRAQQDISADDNTWQAKSLILLCYFQHGLTKG